MTTDDDAALEAEYHDDLTVEDETPEISDQVDEYKSPDQGDAGAAEVKE